MSANIQQAFSRFEGCPPQNDAAFLALHLCALCRINTGDKPSVEASRKMEPAIIYTSEIALF